MLDSQTFSRLRTLIAGPSAKILAQLAAILTEIRKMSATQDNLATEVATLKSNVAALHSGVSDIQARLDAALASAANSVTDPTALTDLHSINDDLKSMVASLAPATASDPAA
jgi:predicted  nucleic acid-binding Zn-ribbon protein